MKDDQKLNQLIEESLRTAYTPTDDLNDMVKKRMEVNMSKRRNSSVRIGVIAAALVAVLSITAFAAWNLLSPGQVAEEFGKERLAAAFAGDGGLVINEMQTAGDYRFTLLGVASGKGLDELAQDLAQDRTYSVMAIERLSAPLPAMSDDSYFEEVPDFLISPLVKGFAPWRANVFTMGGGRSSTVIDGVLYLITECDSVEIFADTGVYLAVTTASISAESYQYDAATGAIWPLSNGDAINLLFDLPLDPAKADGIKAQAFREELEAEFRDYEADDDDHDDALALDDEEADLSFVIQADDDGKLWVEADE